MEDSKEHALLLLKLADKTSLKIRIDTSVAARNGLRQRRDILEALGIIPDGTLQPAIDQLNSRIAEDYGQYGLLCGEFEDLKDAVIGRQVTLT